MGTSVGMTFSHLYVIPALSRGPPPDQASTARWTNNHIVVGAVTMNLSTLSPPPKPRAYSHPSLRMGGLQANSGGGRRAQQSSLAQVRGTGRLLRAFAVRDPRVPFQKPAPRDGQRLSFIYSEASAVSGSAYPRPHLRSAHDNRVTGGVSARPCEPESLLHNPSAAAASRGQHDAPMRQAELPLYFNALHALTLS